MIAAERGDIAPSDAEGVIESSQGSQRSEDPRSPILLVSLHLEEVPESVDLTLSSDQRAIRSWREPVFPL